MDPLTAIRAWFRAAGLFADLWIPAFARMTRREMEDGDPLATIRAWFRAAGLFADLWIPAFAGMAG